MAVIVTLCTRRTYYYDIGFHFIKHILRFAIIVLLFVCCVFVLDYFVGMFFDNKMQQMPNEGERVAKSQYVLNKVEADIVIVESLTVTTAIVYCVILQTID